MEELVLERVGMNNEAANHGAELIVCNLVLRHIDFRSNQDITIEGAIALQSSLRLNKHLLLLDITGARLGPEDRKLIARKARTLITGTKFLY